MRENRTHGSEGGEETSRPLSEGRCQRVGFNGHWYYNLTVINNNPLLLHDAEPGLSYLVCKGVLVDLLNKPMTNPIGNPENAPNNPFGYWLQQPRISFFIPLIRLKKCLGVCDDTRRSADHLPHEC